MRNVKLCHFSFCDLLHKCGSVSVPFPSLCAVEMAHSLVEDFKRDSFGFVALLQIRVPFTIRSA
jgi:hypothetical protein